MNDDTLQCLNCPHFSGAHRPDRCGVESCTCHALETRYGVHCTYEMNRDKAVSNLTNKIYNILASASRFLTQEEVLELKNRYNEVWNMVFPDKMCICNHTLKHHQNAVCRNLQCECVEFAIKEAK